VPFNIVAAIFLHAFSILIEDAGEGDPKWRRERNMQSLKVPELSPQPNTTPLSPRDHGKQISIRPESRVQSPDISTIQRSVRLKYEN
jgi:hypothetical protein